MNSPIWHPLTQHKTSGTPLEIKSAQGAILTDAQGKTYIDAISSWYTCMYGHCHPHIMKAIAAQATQLDQIIFAGFVHEPGMALAQKLVEITPPHYSKVFYSDNGSTSVEVALKMAIQYHHNNDSLPERPVVLALQNGFHGDTLGAMSVSGIDSYNGPFQGLGLEVVRVPAPTPGNLDLALQLTCKALREHNVIACIYEPLVQGAAGMKFMDDAGLDAMLGYLKQYNIFLIADEVMTGFGKLETTFASEQLSTPADFLCLSKALTGGSLPLAVTLTTQEVYKAFLSDSPAQGFFHAHTYTANPLACRAALAAIQVLEREETTQQRHMIAASHKEFVFKMKVNYGTQLLDARSRGVILALDLSVTMSRYGNLRDQLYQFCMERGVYLRPLGNTLYVVPPFVITQDQLQSVYSSLETAVIRFANPDQ